MNQLNDPHEYNRLMETAKKRANELRDEAATQFWSDAAHVGRRALRSAARFAAALARRSRIARHLEA